MPETVMEENCLFEKLRDSFELEKVDIRTYSPLSLAYIGDAVYDLFIRSFVIGKGNTSNNSLHKMSVKYVSAVAQAKIANVIQSELTEDELNIFKRGKNAKPSSGAKNASAKEYHIATGFEALIGYLYLAGNEERIVELVKRGIEETDSE